MKPPVHACPICLGETPGTDILQECAECPRPVRPGRTSLFETSMPAEGQLFWDVQFCEEGRWLYMAGVPRFETEQRATNWMKSFENRCTAAGVRVLLRVKPTFEPYEVDGVEPDRPALPAVKKSADCPCGVSGHMPDDCPTIHDSNPYPMTPYPLNPFCSY